MEDHFKQSFSDPKSEPELMAKTLAGQAATAIRPAASLSPTAPAAAASSAAQDSDPGDLWPEAADAMCSESAALFSGTQPAPLSVV